MVLDGGILFHNRYLLKKRLGAGSFGEVWLANDGKMGKDVAIKIYKALDDDGLEDFKIEIKNTYDLNHPNLIHANHFDDCDGRPYLVMPFCSNGSAMGLPETVDETTVWRFIRDVASGLAYLHNRKNPVIHQDIKPENILIDDEDNFLLTDFGLSKALKYTMSQQSERAISGGTKAYMGPERFSKTPITIKASDIFSLGVSAYYIVMGILPFAGQGGAMLNIGAEIPDIDTDKYSEELNITIGACMAKETWERPTAEELAEYADAQLKGKSITPPWDIRLGKVSDDVSVKTNTDLNKTQVNVKFDDLLEEPENNFEPDEEFIDMLDDFTVELEKWLNVNWDSSVSPKQKQILTELIRNMVKVEGGTFWMGSNVEGNSKPVHRVTLSDYYIGKYQVTQEEWQAVMGCNPSSYKGDRKPVTYVSCDDCQKFIKKLNILTGLKFSLPTEAQWEYAARGGNKSRGYKYSGSNTIGDVARYRGNRSNEEYNEVGQKLPNELDIYDMSGNVYERCTDWFGRYSEDSQINPTGPTAGSFHVIRGGSYFSESYECEVAYRKIVSPTHSGFEIGLRLVLNIN